MSKNLTNMGFLGGFINKSPYLLTKWGYFLLKPLTLKDFDIYSL